MGLQKMKTLLGLLAAVIMLAGLQHAAEGKIVLRLMGDSTMADKDLSRQNPERGWGQRLPAHLDTCVTVVNYARNGKSTGSFISGGLWDRVKSDLEAGDWLFIQFGHNDSKQDDPERYAPAFGRYTENLEMFVSYALSVGANPVVFSPVSRRWFDDGGNLKKDCHGDYPEAARRVAGKYGVPYIDANAITQEWLASTGDEASRKYYMWIPEGTNPRYPEGKVDNTHTNVAGARRIVELLLPAVAEVIPGLSEHMRNYDIVVAKDGSGDFFTVQEAVNAVPDYCRQAATEIYVRPGVYREKVTVPASKQKIHIFGDDARTTVISWDDYALKTNSAGYPMGTSATSTVFVYGDDFFAENLTFENTAGEGKETGQACAITVDADRAAFIRCRFVANQDTIYTYGKGQRHYFRDCWIEGTTDFIFGASTAYFDDCTIYSKKNSYITAASTPEGEDFGYVFRGCRLVAAPGVDRVYLGRPWRPYARTVFIDCEMGSHIVPAGWHNWGKKYAEKTVLYAEYGSRGPGADPSGRVRWSRQLRRKELPSYVPSTVLDAGTETDRNGIAVRNEWFFRKNL